MNKESALCFESQCQPSFSVIQLDGSAGMQRLRLPGPMNSESALFKIENASI